MTPERKDIVNIEAAFESARQIVEQTGDPTIIDAWAAYGKRHISRSFNDTHLEDNCPCKKAPCGLVDNTGVNKDCPEHAVERTKTMRQIHTAADCPGPPHLPVEFANLDRPMGSVVLSQHEVVQILNNANLDSLNLNVAKIYRRMAAQVGLDPDEYTSLSHKYAIPHLWSPSKESPDWCGYCGHYYDGSHWHKYQA